MTGQSSYVRWFSDLRLKDVPLEDVRAAFFYVADNAVVRPHDLGTADELEGIVAAALSRS